MNSREEYSVPIREECLAEAARLLREGEGVLTRGEPPALAAAAASLAQGWARVAMALGAAQAPAIAHPEASAPASAGRARAPEEHTRAWLGDNEEWMILCPTHGEHKAHEMSAKGKAPAMVMCTGKTRGSWCTTGVPADVAYAQTRGR